MGKEKLKLNEEILNKFFIENIETEVRYVPAGYPDQHDPYNEACEEETNAYVNLDFDLDIDGTVYNASVYADKYGEVVEIGNCKVVNKRYSSFEYFIGGKKVDKTPYDGIFETIQNALPCESDFEKACEY